MTADKRSYKGVRLPSGSSMGELFECKGRFLAEQSFADRESEEADLGTQAHLHMSENTPIDEVPDELNYLVFRARELQEICRKDFGLAGPTKTFHEQRIWCKDGDNAFFSGEIDFYEIDATEENASIIDYKFFQGFYASADKNRQLQVYAVLLAQEYPKLKTINLGLVQPMLDKLTTAVIDVENIQSLRSRLIQLSREVQEKGAERKAGTHCKWCRALAHCPEAHAWAKNAIIENMENVSNEELSEKMSMASTLEQFVKEVKKLCKERLQKNIDVPNFKLRASGHITSFDVPKVAEKMFGANLSVNEFLSCCSLKESELVKVWAKTTGESVAKAKQDLRQRIEAHTRIKPKAMSLIRDA